MPTAHQLRQAGAERLAELLERRPDVLLPVPPRSLEELAARLDHGHSLTQALIRLPLPALQVAEALAALGPRADRTSLRDLLGLDRPGTPEDADEALDVELQRLAGYGVATRAGFALEPALWEAWPKPLGLQVSLATVLPGLSVPELTHVFDAWQVRRPDPLRKATLIAGVTNLLNDAGGVRRVVATAPEAIHEHLMAAAFGRRFPNFVAYPHYSFRATRPRGNPLAWAEERLLLVVDAADGYLVMPDVVALALRGPDWRATFSPQPPAADWQPQAERDVQEAGSAASLDALRRFGDVLREIDRAPLHPRKDGVVGARELRRLVKVTQVEAEWLPLLLGLSHQAGLLEFRIDLELSDLGRKWLELDPPDALAVLLEGWATVPAITGRTGELSWAPGERLGAERLRRVMLDVLAEHAGRAPAGRTLLDAVAWRAPILLGRGLNGPLEGAPWSRTPAADGDPGSGPAKAHDDVDEDLLDLPGGGSIATLNALAAEAAFLGVTAAGVLTPVGHALRQPDPEAVPLAARDSLAPAQDEVVLQADLTATALGQPSGRLFTLLDRMADRESRSAATTWRFTPASVRRALDAGETGPGLLADLAGVSRGAVPQPLTYLVTDVARQHGRLRAGPAACYLRSDDAPLLAEVAADRKLRKHDLRLLAPTVLVSGSPLPMLIDALRAAGYGPVEEAADGSPVLRRPRPAPAGPPGRRPTARGRQSTRITPAGPGYLDVATRLLAGRHQPRGLMEMGQTVIDVDYLDDYFRTHQARP